MNTSPQEQKNKHISLSSTSMSSIITLALDYRALAKKQLPRIGYFNWTWLID